jgi:hypothetical protein
MAERRDLLRLASALPLSVLATGALAKSAEAAQSEEAVAGTPRRAADTVTSTASQPAAPQAPPPTTHAPAERAFPNYHLLGSPDADGNLLGAHRPKDWRSTKTALREALRTEAETEDPIHDWLATFSSSFGERATGIVLGAKPMLYASPSASALRYEPQLYDATLRGASALLDRCLRYRNDMGQFEISGVSAGLSYLTFIKTKPLQRNYLEGANNADLAELERDTDNKAASEIARIWGLLRIFESHQLRAQQTELAGSAAGADLEAAKYDFLTSILKRQFNIQSDAQLAQFTRLITSGSASNFAEKYLRLLTMLVEDLTDAYCKIFSASAGVQSVVGLTRVSIGQGPEIDVTVPAFSSAADIDAWVGRVAPQTTGQRKPDVLDAMVLWCRAVMRTLDTLSQYESEFTVSIPLNQPWGGSSTQLVSAAQMGTAFSSGGSCKVSFSLPAGAIPIVGTLYHARVLGLGLSVEFSTDDQSPLQFTSGFPAGVANQPPPQGQLDATKKYEARKMARLNATVTSPPQSKLGGGAYSRPKLFVPNIRIQGGSGGDAEPVLSYDLACRGLNPFGTWTLAFDRNLVEYYPGAPPLDATAIVGVILHLRIRTTLH